MEISTFRRQGAYVRNYYPLCDANDQATFKSFAWKTKANLNLCFVTKGNKYITLTSARRMLSNFAQSQHRPHFIEIGLQIILVSSFSPLRWSFKKADWSAFTINLEKVLPFIPTKCDNYNRFVEALIGTAKKAIPRGF